MTPEEFYDAVAAIFDTVHLYVIPPTPGAKRRWGPRTPGNGRFPGHGIVRFFSPTSIHVVLHDPILSGVFNDPEIALREIRKAEATRRVQHWFNRTVPGEADVRRVWIDGFEISETDLTEAFFSTDREGN